MVVVALSYYLEQEVVQELLIDYIIQVLPVTPEVIIGQIETMLNARTAVSLVALIGFLWAASGVFNTLALNMVHLNRKLLASDGKTSPLIIRIPA